MKKIEGLQVIGFNGSARVDCALAEAIASYGTEADCFFLSDFQSKLAPQGSAHQYSLEDGSRREAEPSRKYEWEEIELEHRRGNLTLLSEPVAAYEAGIAIYISQAFLQGFYCGRPEELWRDVDYQWSTLKTSESETGSRGPMWATCVPTDIIIPKLKDWGESLSKMADDRLVDFFAAKDEQTRADAERLIKLALQAAPNAAERSKIYLRYAVAVANSDTYLRLDSVFKRIIMPQYPDLTREEFDKLWKTHNKRLKKKARSRNPNNEESETYYTGNDVDKKIRLHTQIFITAIQRPYPQRVGKGPLDRLFELIETIDVIEDDEERFKKSKQTAERCRDAFKVGHFAIRSVIEKMSSGNSLIIKTNDLDALKAISGSPVIYYKRAYKRANRWKHIIMRLEKEVLLHNNLFYLAAKEMHDKGFQLDEIGISVLDNLRKGGTYAC